MNELLHKAPIRMTQFTGSSRVAEYHFFFLVSLFSFFTQQLCCFSVFVTVCLPIKRLLAKELHGKIKIEDAGFDWKIMGPDVPQDKEFVTFFFFFF